MINKLLSLLLALGMLMSLCMPALADNSESKEVISITDPGQLLDLAENCRLDSYSQGLTVSLDADVDLTDTDFSGIPIFCGTFRGNSHRISGIHLTGEGSVQGFFRFLSPDAHIDHLSLQGEVTPEGTHNDVGGLAGINSGTVTYCSFDGTVSGSDRIGGLVGTNRVTGVLEDCITLGSLHGNHFAGGSAGQNDGLIRRCASSMQVNTSVIENEVELSEITIDSLLGTESARTVTDIGGIAGTSSGVIRSCQNRGNVGYPHIGYNIGGIAGSQRGYITDCLNFGSISGRKEVGGIAGQIEPVSKIEYTEDTLQILQQQLAGTSALTGRASANAMNSAADIGAQLSAMEDQSRTAQEALEQLLPDPENPKLPDADAILAARNTLTGSMTAMQDSIRNVSTLSQDALHTTAQDIEAISGQINAMSQTLGGAADNLGGTVTDVSDQDSEETLTGKVELCTNHGPVSGDLNTGGIAGAMARENDMDPEDDLVISGNQSLNFNSELRCVLRNCKNDGAVTAKKRNAGGIVGSLSLGLVRDCENSGRLNAENGEYIGGIAGFSSGYIRSCNVKCQLSGNICVGGIAGSAPIVTDCRSLVSISEGKEKLGAVLGEQTEAPESQEAPVAGNLYLRASQDPGAIDGISYEGLAQPEDSEVFLNLEGLSSMFRKSVITFQYGDGSRKTFMVDPGQSLDRDQIPDPADHPGEIWQCEDLKDEDLQNIYFDRTYHVLYSPCYTALRSSECRENDMPIVLTEGQYTGSDALILSPAEAAPSDKSPAECWNIPRPEGGLTEKIHYLAPDGMDPSKLEILILHSDGSREPADSVRDGSYLVFPAAQEDQAFCVMAVPADFSWLLYVIVGVIAVAVIIFIFCRKRKSSKKRPQK